MNKQEKPRISLFPFEDFRRVWNASTERNARLALIADMCRANTLAMVKRAGSGHLGSSFSAMDILVWLYYEHLNIVTLGLEDPDRDIYFSSKGHDVPGLYSVLFSLGILPEEKILKLRRLGGLDGHPHVGTPGIEANSGSLGMGISKAKGMAFAKRLACRKGCVVVMVGDGELQEGQNYEALQHAAARNVSNLTVIVDYNKVQSDKPVDEICDPGDVERKLRAFGWNVVRCNGHDFESLARAFAEPAKLIDKPRLIVADTIKGKGVSFMEHPAALESNGGLYRWHSGAPDDDSFRLAHDEILARIGRKLSGSGLDPLFPRPVPAEKNRPGGVSKEYVSEAYGQALLKIAAEREDVVVLDADLAADCRVRMFEETYPERFIECGIAEQDMVSTAGGLALQGFLPVVNSFASFLASRANEQIYTNAGENTKVIYACHYAGLIPAGPGLSHQSVRDISLFSALPNCIILQPCNASETKMAVDYCIGATSETCMIRLAIGPSPRLITLPDDYRLIPGRGVSLRHGDDVLLISYGPVMLHEALKAAEIAEKQNCAIEVVNMSWLNRFDEQWLEGLLAGHQRVYILEDHMVNGGLGDRLLAFLCGRRLLQKREFHILGLSEMPVWGTPQEVLSRHGLDGQFVARRIISDML
jgi:transketolase